VDQGVRNSDFNRLGAKVSDKKRLTGTTRTLFHVGGPTGPRITSGEGDPNGAIAGYPGDIFFDTNGLLWVKESGLGDGFGWIRK